MHIEDFEPEEVVGCQSEKKINDFFDDSRVRVSGDDPNVVAWDTKRVLIGAGARALFYPTLVYNVVRNKVQSEFRWWDRIDKFVLLGAVPFPSDVLRLKELGVHGVITLNEPYETLVPTSLYHVQHKKMTPEDAYSYVRSIRPRVQLASIQWQAVKDYYNYKVKSCSSKSCNDLMIIRSSGLPPVGNLFEFDDCSVVVVTKSDLDGYDPSKQSVEDSQIFADLSVIYKARVAGQAALARLSCLWLRCHTQQKIAEEQLLRQGSCTITADQISGSLTVDIRVY
uniref:Dual specificity protein phosphatase DSP8 n=1 Tax=Chenopodium quinoa TaxID=63459 RepID=A0A803LUJ9_CHEQI